MQKREEEKAEKRRELVYVCTTEDSMCVSTHGVAGQVHWSVFVLGKTRLCFFFIKLSNWSFEQSNTLLEFLNFRFGGNVSSMREVKSRLMLPPHRQYGRVSY